MKKKEIKRKGELLAELLGSDGYEVLYKYTSDEINRITGEIIRADFNDLKELYFLKGQLIGLGKVQSYPKIIINEMNRQKKENKELKSGRK